MIEYVLMLVLTVPGLASPLVGYSPTPFRTEAGCRAATPRELAKLKPLGEAYSVCLVRAVPQAAG